MESSWVNGLDYVSASRYCYLHPSFVLCAETFGDVLERGVPGIGFAARLVQRINRNKEAHGDGAMTMYHRPPCSFCL